MIRPHVTVSYAQTIDGRLATCTGSSQWISCPGSLGFSHGLRAKHDAIMVGVGTIRADDPRLTVRLASGEDPLRVVVDSTLRTPMDAAVLSDGVASGTILAVTENAPADRRREAADLGARVLESPTDSTGREDLKALLSELAATDVRSVMAEGGAGLITALLRGRLVDRLAVCIAPKILGSGIEAVGDLGISDLADSVTLDDVSVIPYGTDLILDGRVGYPGRNED